MKTALIVAVLLLTLVTPPVAATTDLPRLAVLGIGCDSKNAEWRSGLVGFGVENWVAQAFYDSGRYRMFEEQPGVMQSLTHTGDQPFDESKFEHASDFAAAAQRLGVDLVAVGRVSTYYSMGQHLTIGPMHSLTRDTIIKVDISLFDARSGKVVKVSGSGKVGRKGQSFGADYAAGKLPFDPSTVAPATEEAVEQAVSKLAPGYHSHARQDEPATLASTLTLGVLPVALRATVATEYPELKTKRVAFGLQSRIAHAVSDSKSCALQEIDPAVLDTLAEQWWIGSTGAPAANDVKSQAPALAGHVNYIVYGEVFSFSVARQEHAEGLTGKISDKVTVGVQLRAIDPTSTDAGYLVASGTGVSTGDWERWKGQSDDFAQTFVGQAATDAVNNAWRAMLSDMARKQH